MILRPRQVKASDKSVAALNKHGNTLIVGATGFGKTILMGSVCQRMMVDHNVKRSLTIQHRDELTKQNMAKFRKFTSNQFSVSRFDSECKSFRGQAVFGMVQTLVRSIDRIPDDIGLVNIDEAHHVTAQSYQDVIGTVLKKNPDAKIFGVTATPNRGDRKTLRGTFDNVADEITIAELVASGHLVTPRTFKPEIGDLRQSVNSVSKTAKEYDMSEVADLMDKEVVTDEVIRHWKEKAGDRKTIIFCANTDHAEHVCDEFQKAGISARFVHSKMEGSRKAVMKAFENDEFQVLINVFILTEGFDDQTVSCVVILRPSAYKSTFIQIVGRGLRTVDPELHPGIIKTDCIILDFGTDHENLEQSVKAAIKEEQSKGEPPLFPECKNEIPIQSLTCPLCGHEIEKSREEYLEGQGDNLDVSSLSYVDMIEIDLLKKSNFIWHDLYGNGKALIASGFEAWAGVFCIREGLWSCVGSYKNENNKWSPVAYLSHGDKMQCLARANDFINEHETEDAAHKSGKWLRQPPSEKQLQILHNFSDIENSSGLSRYGASCTIQYKFNQHKIIRAVSQHHPGIVS